MKASTEDLEGGSGVVSTLRENELVGVRRWAVPVALAAATAAGVATFGPLLGMPVRAATLAVVVLGALVVEAIPARAFELATASGLLALAATNHVYVAYHVALVAALFAARNTTARLAFVLLALAIWLPKHLFAAHYHEPGFYNWLNEPSLVLAIFVTASWWAAHRADRLPPVAREASLATWAALYFFPGHAVNPMVYGPADLFRARRLEVRGVLTALLLVAGKALAHTALWKLFPHARYAGLDGARAIAAPRAELWGVVALNYVDLALTLSGTADLAVLIARLYGWQLPNAFNFALLAWNPGELWRRWGIYNRKLLLQLVYFPLGGANRHRYMNVMLTFLGSALLLHTGFFGSKYWEVGVGGWRDETIYFLIQGALVCAWIALRELRGGRVDHTLRWSWSRAAGTVATQAASALAHVVILATALPLQDRFALIARCLGLR
ncbi:MAG TPA: hypothetical protein VHJ20_17255 [Polyangia bacterium]|nr:hypothetical protein [Polyangia bacterium]